MLDCSPQHLLKMHKSVKVSCPYTVKWAGIHKNTGIRSSNHPYPRFPTGIGDFAQFQIMKTPRIENDYWISAKLDFIAPELEMLDEFHPIDKHCTSIAQAQKVAMRYHINHAMYVANAIATKYQDIYKQEAKKVKDGNQIITDLLKRANKFKLLSDIDLLAINKYVHKSKST